MDSGSYSQALALRAAPQPRSTPDCQAQDAARDGPFLLVTAGTGSQTRRVEARAIPGPWELLPGEAPSWGPVWPELQPLLRLSPARLWALLSRAHPQAHSPEGGAQCRGLGLPQCPMPALLLAGAMGQAWAARPGPDAPRMGSPAVLAHGELQPSWCPETWVSLVSQSRRYCFAQFA